MSLTELSSNPLNAVVQSIREDNETTHVERFLWLQTLLGDAVTAADIRPLALLLKEHFVPKGGLLFTANSPPEHLHFIVSGEVRYGEKGFTRFVANDVIGFVDSLIDRPHPYDAIVQQDAVILRLKVTDWLGHLEDHFPTLQRIILNNLRDLPTIAEPSDPSSELVKALLEFEEESTPSGLFVRRLLAVRACETFRTASVQALSQVVRRSHSIFLSPGETLPEAQKQPGIFVVVCGSCEVVFPEATENTSTLCPPGSLLCSLHSLVELPDDCEIRAQSTVEILHILPEKFFDIMEDHFDLGRSALSYFARRREAANQAKTQ